MNAQVIVFPRGQPTDLDRARMEEVGIVAVEADDPAAVVTVIPGVPLATPDEMLLSAMEAVNSSSVAPGEFVSALVKRMKKREGASA